MTRNASRLFRSACLAGVACLLAPLHPAHAQAAGEDDYCTSYAKSAVRQAQENLNLNCGLSGPRWLLDAEDHFTWCKTVTRAAAEAESAARNDALADCRSRSSTPSGGGPAGATGTIVGQLLPVDDACTRYAKDAVSQQQLNEQKKCGFTGPRWSADQTYHDKWCRRQSNIDVAMAEHKVRLDMLVACQTPATPGDPRKLKPLMVPGLMLALWHGGMGLSRDSCKNGKVFSTDRDLSVVAKGEWLRLLQRLNDGRAKGYSPECAAELAETTEDFLSFSWMAIDDAPSDIDIRKLPPGLVLAFQPHLAGQTIKGTAFGVTPSPPAKTFQDGPLPGTKSFYAPDVSGQAYEKGWVWYETDRRPASQVDWTLAERLPRFTVVGLKYTANSSNDWRGNQWWKRLQWLGADGKMQLFDPACRDCAAPPGFVRVEAGDLGAPAGQGLVWFMKVTGPDIAQQTAGN